MIEKLVALVVVVAGLVLAWSVAGDRGSARPDESVAPPDGVADAPAPTGEGGNASFAPSDASPDAANATDAAGPAATGAPDPGLLNILFGALGSHDPKPPHDKHKGRER